MPLQPGLRVWGLSTCCRRAKEPGLGKDGQRWVPTCCPTCGLPVPPASASHRPTLCPAGTFSSLPEQTVSSVCQACPRGFYCKETGLQAPSGPCPTGERQQRPGGAGEGARWGLRTPGQQCPGHRPQGPCDRTPAGTELLRKGRTVLSAPQSRPGYYCDSTAGPVQDFSLYPCPLGYYCPLGTAVATQHSCPVGTYGPWSGLGSIAECQPCPSGKFCALAGLGAPTGADVLEDRRGVTGGAQARLQGGSARTWRLVPVGAGQHGLGGKNRKIQRGLHRLPTTADIRHCPQAESQEAVAGPWGPRAPGQDPPHCPPPFLAHRHWVCGFPKGPEVSLHPNSTSGCGWGEEGG